MTLPSAKEMKLLTRVINIVEKQGASIVIMGFTVWIFYGLFQEQNQINMQYNEDMRKEMKDQSDYIRDVLQEVVEKNTITMEKWIEINKAKKD